MFWEEELEDGRQPEAWEKIKPKLLRAAKKGDLKKIKYILNREMYKGVFIYGEETIDAGGNSIFHILAEHGHANILEKLLSEYCWGEMMWNRENTSGDRALHLAASGGHYQAVKVLLGGGAKERLAEQNKFGETVFHTGSMQSQNDRIIRELVKCTEKMDDDPQAKCLRAKTKKSGYTFFHYLVIRKLYDVGYVVLDELPTREMLLLLGDIACNIKDGNGETALILLLKNESSFFHSRRGRSDVKKELERQFEKGDEQMESDEDIERHSLCRIVPKRGEVSPIAKLLVKLLHVWSDPDNGVKSYEDNQSDTDSGVKIHEDNPSDTDNGVKNHEGNPSDTDNGVKNHKGNPSDTDNEVKSYEDNVVVMYLGNLGLVEALRACFRRRDSKSFCAGVDDQKRTVLHIAARDRMEGFINWFKSADNTDYNWKRVLLSGTDSEGQTALHYAAMPAGEEKRFNLGRLATEIMNDYKWFKQIEGLMPSDLISRRNKKTEELPAETPEEMFLRKHTTMAKTNEGNIRTMATTSMSLVAAVAFATTFSLPSGVSETGGGQLKREEQLSFYVFTRAYVLGLSFAVTTIIASLFLYLSPFHVESFRTTVPRRFYLCLVSLCMCLLSLIVAFACNLRLSLDKYHITKAIFLYTFTAVGPLTLAPYFAFLLFRHIYRQAISWGKRLSPARTTE